MSIKLIELNVEGMSCSHCENSVKKSVGALDGVQNVKVELDNKKIIVEYDDSKIEIDLIKEEIDNQGYDVI